MALIGWLAIPHAALAAAGRDGRLAVLDLYERAHLTGYGPIGFTDRELADEWGIGRKAVWSVLDRLERAGLVTVDRADPGSRRASSVTVQRPVGEGRRHTTPIPEPDLEPEPVSFEANDSQAGATRGATPGASPGPARVELFAGAKTRADETRAEEQQDVVRTPDPDRYDEAALYFGEIVHRAIGRRPSKGPERKSKLGQKLLREVTRDADRVLDALRYVAEGRGDKAAYLRSYDGLTVETITRHVEEYSELWRAEQEPGWRPRGPPAQARRGQSTAGDGVLDEVIRRARATEQGHGDDERGSSVLAGDRGGWDPEALVYRR